MNSSYLRVMKRFLIPLILCLPLVAYAQVNVQAPNPEQIQAYLSSLKPEPEKHLLVPDRKAEVAYRVGSSSPSAFSREFKKHFGYPPSQVMP